MLLVISVAPDSCQSQEHALRVCQPLQLKAPVWRAQGAEAGGGVPAQHGLEPQPVGVHPRAPHRPEDLAGAPAARGVSLLLVMAFLHSAALQDTSAASSTCQTALAGLAQKADATDGLHCKRRHVHHMSDSLRCLPAGERAQQRA